MMDLDFNSPETIRFLAKDRANTLKKAKTTYRIELDEARENYDYAKSAYEDAALKLADLKAKLAPLDDEIAHLEAVAASEDASFEMLFWAANTKGN